MAIQGQFLAARRRIVCYFVLLIRHGCQTH